MKHILIAAMLLILPMMAGASPNISDPPALRSAMGYVTHVEVAVFNGPVADVKAALQTAEHGVLAHTQPTSRIPAIADLTPISGAFPANGAIRRVTLADGNSVVERVLENSETIFAYQIWDFTAPSARALSHIRGEFRYVAIGENQTEVTWTYAIAPRAFFARPFIRSFLKDDFAPFMQSGLRGAAQSYNAEAGS